MHFKPGLPSLWFGYFFCDGRLFFILQVDDFEVIFEVIKSCYDYCTETFDWPFGRFKIANLATLFSGRFNVVYITQHIKIDVEFFQETIML